jgi:choice-of-anchor B domain-containing protein
MSKFYLFLLFIALTFQSQAQQSLNTTLVGTWTEGVVDFNDCWGYVDPAGNEYALIGSLTKFYVIHLPNGGTPTKVGEVTGGGSSIWRDMKTYGTYMYGVADQSGTTEGLTVINLANLPSSVSLVGQFNSQFTRAHNVFIDVPNAKLYLSGSSGGTNPANNGIMIYSLANPAAPSLIGSYPLPGGYVHEAFVKDNILYASHGGNGLYIYNCTSGAPILLGSINNYPYDGYNHSGWLSSDGQRYVMADETYGTKLKYVDVSTPSDPEVNANNIFRQCLIPTDTSCIPHNPFIKGNLCYIAYYHDGLVIFNMTNPTNIQRVGWYDSEPGNTNYAGWAGAWGTYPFLPSDRIIISDIEHGLFVVEVTGALPVDLTNFRGKLYNDAVLLNWETDAELNNKQFEIERSNDGYQWTEIGIVRGHGSTSDAHSYSFKDEHPFTGDNYYRLRQVDFDGSSEVSKAIHVKLEDGKGLRVFPNTIPEGYAEIQAEIPASVNDVQLEITDMQGRIVYTRTFPANETSQQVALPVTTLPKGMYVVNAEIDGLVFSVKVVK